VGTSGLSGGWWRVRAVDPPYGLEFEDGFADGDGNPRPDAPTAMIRVALSELPGGGTQMDVTTTDSVNTRMRNMPATVVSSTLQEPLDWPNATVVSGDAVDVVARLKTESEVPLRSHGSLSLNRALMAAGLVDFRARDALRWSRAGPSTVTSRSSSTGPRCTDLRGSFADAHRRTGPHLPIEAQQGAA
jgi:hypothetical protein